MTVDVSRYFSNMDGSVYALLNLPEEVVAYLFARYSRSTLSLRDDLRQMIAAEDLGALIGGAAPAQGGEAFAGLQERARAFAEKYVLGYGHSSVSEHGCVHLAIEDVSIIASKLIEDARLASYTEKSTRYVAFDPEKVYHPPAVMADPRLAEEYAGTIRALLCAYTEWAEPVIAQIQSRVPRGEKQTERAYAAACRASAFDTLRYLLPAATWTNLGLTLNARSLEHLITKLLSQPLPEGRELGARLKAEAQHVLPTLLKYADPNPYRAETESALDALAAEIASPALPHPRPLSLPGERGEEAPPAPNSGGAGERRAVSLVATDPDADAMLVAAILYGHAALPMGELLGRARAMGREMQERVVDEYLARRGKHDAPGRALERVACTMELTMDYGAYRDVQRHRMATQTTQALSPGLGFETPPDIIRFGYEEQYEVLMARAAATYDRLADAGLGLYAPYVLPLATRIRALFTWNLREVFHFVELRSARQGHPSYRRIAQEVYRAVAEAHPLIARYMRPNMNQYDLTRD
ncbi:MAG: FAD-dependent thymidylate synthase [Armatimonadetes bacterium]|nr:FAD-dependent thymidylate synthase [Armatimonadota bacterium]